MNIVGKILIVFILVASVATAGFVSVVYVTRTNWKKYTDDFKKELDIAGRNVTLAQKTNADLRAELKVAHEKLETEKKDHKTDVDDREAKLKVANSRIDEEIERAKEADLAAQRAQGAVARIQEEVAGLTKVIEERQKKVVELEQTTKGLRDFARAKEKESQDDRTRNKSLIEENKNLRLETAKLQAGPDGKKSHAPAVNVKGVIEKIDREEGLVQISLGSDQGLKENDVLQVRRMRPRPEYLGEIELVEVHFHKSIGRWISRPSGKKLQPGDQVVSALGV